MNRSLFNLKPLLASAGVGAALLIGSPVARGLAAPVPAPEVVLGFEPCSDYKLATYEAIEGYFRALASAAPERVRLVDIGRTVEGRTELLAVITSEKNMRRIERYKQISRSLALTHDRGRPLGEDQAHALAREGRAVVWIDFGLHSSEVAHAQTAPLVAYKVVTDESDEVRAIRDNVVFLLAPNLNPDGTTMVSDWYMRNVGTAWESRLPELWHTYAGHDDNRDWFMMTQPETRNAARQLYTEWLPQIVYDQHQSGPYPSRIFVPPFDEPTNPNIQPLVMRGVSRVGEAIMRRLEREGKRGALTRVGFDAWWNGGMRTTPYFHNMVGILTETAHPSATPTVIDPSTFPRQFANGRPTGTPSPDYPNPYLGGRWRMRHSCDYMLSASLAVLDIAARRRSLWLYGSYQMGRHAVTANRDERFLIPATQWDGGTAVKLVNILRLGGVEVERATTAFKAGDSSYDAGSFVIRGAQAFEPYVKDLLMPQVYPDVREYPGGPIKQPYDITGWTLSLQMGVKVDRITTPIDVRTEPVDVAKVPESKLPRAPWRVAALDPRANDSFIAVNRLLKAGVAVFRMPGVLETPEAQWPAGAFVVEPRRDAPKSVEAIARSLGLDLVSLETRPSLAVPMRAPRVGVYHAWGGNSDEGWTRWVLEQFEFPYTRLHDAAVRAGQLLETLDVIVLPDATYRQMRDGLRLGSMPEPYTGGMTDRGVAHLRAFVEQGGTLVALGAAVELPLQAFGLPVQDVTVGLPLTDLKVPGSILSLGVDPSHPVGYGLPADTAAFVSDSPAFALPPPGAHPAAGPVRVAWYQARRPLLSGWMQGEHLLANRAAVVDLPLGRGRVVLLGVRTQHRGQPHGTFKLLFNSLYISALGPAWLR